MSKSMKNPSQHEKSGSYSEIIKEASQLGDAFFLWLEANQSIREEYKNKKAQKEKLENRVKALQQYLLDNADKAMKSKFSRRKFVLLWNLWKDKDIAQLVADEKYKLLQTKNDLSKNRRQRIHAGLILMAIHHLGYTLDTAELIKQLNALLNQNITGDDDRLIKEYYKAQYAISHFNEKHGKFSLHNLTDFSIAAFYAFCSAVTKGTAAAVVFLTFGINPPAWVAILLFAGFAIVFNLNTFSPNKTTKNIMFALGCVGLIGLVALGVTFVPTIPWFITSVVVLIGFVAAMQSYQMVSNIYAQSRKQSKHGGILQELLYKTDEHGVQKQLTGREKWFVWGICVPFSFAQNLVFVFIGYQALMYFVASLPILATFAAWPAAPFIIFGFILSMQLFSSLTVFRFSKNAFIKLANTSFQDIKNTISTKVNNYFDALREHPFKTVAKSLLACTLVGIALMYLFVGAKVASVSFMHFAGIELTSLSRTIGIVIGLFCTIPTQVVFSYSSNTKLYALIMSICSSIKERIHPSPKASVQDPRVAEVETKLRKAEWGMNALARVKSFINMLLNVIGKASLKMDPHHAAESIPNMGVEGTNAMASGMLGVKGGRPAEFFDKDVQQIIKITRTDPVQTNTLDATLDFSDEETLVMPSNSHRDPALPLSDYTFSEEGRSVYTK